MLSNEVAFSRNSLFYNLVKMVGWLCIVVLCVLLLVDHPVQWLQSPSLQYVVVGRRLWRLKGEGEDALAHDMSQVREVRVVRVAVKIGGHVDSKRHV